MAAWSRRRKVAVTFSSIAVLALVAIAFMFGPRLGPLHVTVKNESSSALQGLSIQPEVGEPVDLPRITPGSSVTVRLTLPEFRENVLFLVDSGARRYLLLPYFEGDPRGSVSVTIAGGAPGDLQGDGVDQSGYSPRGRFKLE